MHFLLASQSPGALKMMHTRRICVFGSFQIIPVVASSVGWAVGLAMPAQQAMGQPAPRYTLTVIGATFNDSTNPNKIGRALGINNLGVVVGEWNVNRAFVWTNGTMTFLTGAPDPGPGNQPAYASRINDAGQIAGLHIRPTPCCGPVTQPAFWASATSSPIIIGTLNPNNDGIGTVGGMNASGRIAGESAINPSNRYNGYLFTPPGSESALGQLNGSDNGNAAYGINDLNVCVGDVFVGSDRRAVRWNTNGTVTNLNTLPNGGVGGSSARDINNSGVIVGYSFPLPTRAVLWQTNSTMPTSLGALAANQQSVANAINNSGVVVGKSNDRGFVWSGSLGMVDLNAQVNNPGGHQIIDASDINDAGQIAAIARITLTGGTQVNRAVVLSPVPGHLCDSIDFNNDGLRFDPMDIAAFLSRYGQGPCVPASATCNDIDFNNDGASFDPTDIQAFISVFSEGPCL